MEQSDLIDLQSVLSRQTEELNGMTITKIHVLGFLIPFFCEFH